MGVAVSQGVIASSVNRVVVGLGLTGLSCARHLYRSGASFSVLDTRDNPPGLQELRSEMPDVPVYAGDYPEELITGASELIVSPGIAMDDPLVSLARGAGVDVVGDIDLFMREAAAPVVGITGSNAKSTVTELLGQMARQAGVIAGVGGNLGTPALDLLDAANELYILELSSFQLERAGTLGFAVATVLNVSADHLDRHGSMPRYHQAKHRVFRGCQKAVINRDDPLTVPLVAEDVALIAWTMGRPALGRPGQADFGLMEVEGQVCLCHGFDVLMPVTELAMPGGHNVANALAALALGYAADLPLAPMCETLRNFTGLPHRCELVASIDGVRFVDDSKGTNIGATQAALSGLGTGRNILLIAGGQGKGADFTQLRPVVEEHCKQLILIGEDAPLIEQALTGVAPVTFCNSMEEAVAVAAAGAGPGDTVLLSPACASFDMFSGFVARGQAFAAAVIALGGAA
jgi:UDP-N-acetylmuramoylalanine--D-glutamate ligase